ncbi:uncharacterized protein RCC_01583 [Ramularia collo-cygni]|uniref:Uncharacterized protein n=1 Tax=Ramularia collo-cygni TaxID=112498 RepID=A0A2D3V2L6_9PEZI|nr:uncharacterized protein RCC_01583 [Ramularia collo-cygni]CZT15749.1 uncharacterized protein RCC_01583 [Ramularia collo-cygni]
MVHKVPVVIYSAPEPYPPPKVELDGYGRPYTYDEEPEATSKPTRLTDEVRARIGTAPPGYEWKVEPWEPAPDDPEFENPIIKYRVRARRCSQLPDKKSQSLQLEKSSFDGFEPKRIVARVGQQIRLQYWQISKLEKHTSQNNLPDFMELEGLGHDLKERHSFNAVDLPFGLRFLSTLSPLPLERKICNDYKDKQKEPDIRCTMGKREIGTIRSAKGGSCYVLCVAERETSLVQTKESGRSKLWRFFPTSIGDTPGPWQWEYMSHEWSLKDSLGDTAKRLARFDSFSLTFEHGSNLSDATREEVLLSVIAIFDWIAQFRKEAERLEAERQERAEMHAEAVERGWGNGLMMGGMI